MSAAADPGAAPLPLRGLVDAADGAALGGWAFEIGQPAARVAVELRLHGTLLAATRADMPRPDLAEAGIGDGAHGFRFPLQPGWAERQSELQVVARSAAGAAALLPFRRAPPPQRAPEPRLPQVAPVPPIPADVERRIEVLEAWAARLDETLARLPVAAPPPPAGPDPWQVALATLLALVGLGALIGFALLLAL